MLRNSNELNNEKSRYGFLDLYRGIMVFFMIQGHLLRELLNANYKNSALFTFHEVFHGITAPGFLFGAGFTFAIATQRRWIESITLSNKFIKRIARALMLISFGYLLHAPFLSIQKIISTASYEQINNMFLFDALQCIGFGLLFLCLTLFILKNEKIFISILFISFLCVVYLTPILWNIHSYNTLPKFITDAFTAANGSSFPIFPFMGFLFAGTLTSWLYLRFAQNNKEQLIINIIVLCGLIFLLFGFIFDKMPIKIYSVDLFWYTSPNYFFIRLGILLIFLGILWYAEKLFFYNKLSLPPIKWITTLGVESFFVYIIHLIILYGWITNADFNLSEFYQNKLNVGETIIACIIFVVTIIPITFGWRYLKKQHSVLVKGIIGWMIFCISWSVIFSPY